MTVAVRAFDHRYIPVNQHAGYGSNTVGQLTSQLEDDLKHKGSPTVRESQPNLLTAVWNAQGAPGVTENTIAAAVQLVCALPEGLLAPEITAESTGEIAFEWYGDNRHLVVLTVQDNLIRWSALLGTGKPVYGREFFSRTIPGEAMLAIQSVIE
jgi:hypothetical protein